MSTTRGAAVFVTEARSVLGEGSPLGVVYNSLSHDEYIPSAAELIAQGGWFVEIGKRGIWSRTQMAAEQLQVRYKVAAMDGGEKRAGGGRSSGGGGSRSRSRAGGAPSSSRRSTKRRA